MGGRDRNGWHQGRVSETMSRAGEGASSQLAAFARRFGRLTPSAIERRFAWRAALDTWAVAVAALDDPVVAIARRHLDEVAGHGAAHIWGDGTRLPVEEAAWFNALAAHVFDYDDVLTPMRAHVSATLVPALQALACAQPTLSHRYPQAWLAGYEVMAAMAPVLALDHYSRGWHSTSALGVIGVTLGCAVLLDLDEAQTIHALGLAVAQAAGTRENFGAMAKSFQAGICAAAAVRSVRLAALGFTSAPGAIDGPYGFTRLYAAGEDLAPALARLGERPLAIERVGIDLKKYPCCYAIHRALDALLALRVDDGFAVGEVERIEVLTSARGREALIGGEPLDSLQGKFSLPYTLALGLIDGRVDLESYRPQAFGRAEVMALMRIISLTEAEGPVLPRWSEVTVYLRDGRRLARRVQVAHGDAPDPLTDEELRRKAADCLAFAGAEHDGASVVERLLPAAEVPVPVPATEQARIGLLSRGLRRLA